MDFIFLYMLKIEKEKIENDISNFIKWLYNGYEDDKIGLKRKYEKSLLFV
jgi:hypothetical protein